MRLSGLIILITILISCKSEKPLDGNLILNQSIAVHDSSNSWSKTVLNLHIQEPRVSNPYRYSIVKLDNSLNTFELTRNRGQHISKHIIDSLGNSFVLFDGKIETDTAVMNKYRLDVSRNFGYRNFYQLFYGMPMSLSSSLEKITKTSENTFNEVDCYKIEMELKEAVISKYWCLYVSKSDLQVVGLEIVFPDNPNAGERLYFDQLILVNGLKIPRIRHWHELNDDAYSGTDLIIKEIIQ